MIIRELLALLFCVAILADSAIFAQNLPSKSNATDRNPPELTVSVDLLWDKNCSMELEQTMPLWDDSAISPGADTKRRERSCSWTRVRIENPFDTPQKSYLYFPLSWNTMEVWLPGTSGRYFKEEYGTRMGRQILVADLAPDSVLVAYVHYPQGNQAFNPLYTVWQLSEEEYLRIPFTERLKFFLLGAVVLFLLFFSGQYIIERDRLNFAYVIFLLGASLHLITILDFTPFFQYTRKIVSSVFTDRAGQQIFVISVLLTLASLVKYIHYLLEVRKWNRPMHLTGNILNWIFFGICLWPFIIQQQFQIENYGSYLLYLRVCALILVSYILILIIWAAYRKVKYSGILLLAFTPFVLGSLYYAIIFTFRGSYTSNHHESFILIGGFFLTIVLFGLILGVRNKVVKSEKVKLEQRTIKLRELDEFKSRFYTNFTHEFRTPLTVISGVTGQINGHEKEKSLILRNSKRLLNTVNQLLELSRLENRSISVNMVQGNVINFLQYLTESCSSIAHQKKINLAFFSHHEELYMDYDAVKLQQILVNLISNAIKFTPEFGTVKVIADEKQINKEKFLLITVKDTGMGISPVHLPYVFDRFYQVDSSDTRKEEGSGIGLALVKEMVHILGGRIEVESDQNKGTVFDIYLPLHQSAALVDPDIPTMSQTIPAEVSDVIEDSASNGQEKPLVLLIEDNADVTEYILSCLRNEFAVVSARNGKVGVEKAIEIIPDVIISDVMMPEMDGFEASRILKADRRTSHIPIMLLTAKATQEDRVTGFQRGADAYLTKPFDKEELMIRLSNLSAISRRIRENITSVAVGDPDATDELSLKENAFIKEVDELIHQHMENPDFDTTMLCREVAMSRTQLHRKLKALTGDSTAHFIRVRRLKKARELLALTDLPVGEITLKVGYKDFSHFSRSYAKEFGETPSESRN